MIVDELSTASILDLIPPNLAADPGVIMAAQAFDDALHEIVLKIPAVSILPRINEIVDGFLLDLLAWQFHVDFYDSGMSIQRKRELVQRSLEWHSHKGTPGVVEEVVTAAIADAQITEWFEWGGDPYFFRITTELPLSDAYEVEQLINAIWSVKNTRSWLEFIIALTIARQSLYVGIGVVCDDVLDIGIAKGPERGSSTGPVYAGAYTVYSGKVEIFARELTEFKASIDGACYAGGYSVLDMLEIEINAGG